MQCNLFVEIFANTRIIVTHPFMASILLTFGDRSKGLIDL